MAYKINEDLYIGNTNKQLKDLLVPDGDTLPIGAIVDFDGSTIPDGYARYIDPNVMSETILFDTNIWDSMMKRYETKNIDFTPYTYVEVHFTGQGGTNATNTILKIDLTKPFQNTITNSSISYSYGASVCFPDIQLLQGSNNDPGIFRIGACISTDKKKIWMGDPGYFTGQTNSGNFDANSIYSRISKIVGFKPTIRIKKIQQSASYPENSIYDAYSTSTTDTYSCNYINEVNNNMYAKIGLTSSVSTTAGEYNKIPYDSIIEIEEGLLLNNNGIKVSKKGKYLVTLIARLNLTGTVYLAIRKNNNDSNEALVSCNINGGVHTLSAVVNCQENDTIYGYVYSSNSIILFGGGNPPIWVSMAVTKM